MILRLKSTALTTMQDMFRATSDLLHAYRTIATGAPSENYMAVLSNWKRVYDLAGAGPRNRFMIITAAGPLLVHNSGELGLGFGCGPDKFYNMVLRSGRLMGMDMTALKKVWTLELARRSVYTYRDLHKPIKYTWRKLDEHLQTAWCGIGPPLRFGPVVVEKGAVLLPNYMRMRYDVTSTDPVALEYKYGRFSHTMYGSKFLENIVQALARIVIMNAALRLSGRGYEFAHQEHDALTFIVPDADVDNAKKIIYEEATRRPSWALTLPLDADVSSGQSYGG
jgi:hypothetical protein